MIYAIADIHGYYDLFRSRIELLEPELEKQGNRLVLLGDYIDRGPDSFRSLELAHSLQKKHGKEKVIALKGNHEEWFLDFIEGRGDEWLAEDENFNTSGTFLDDEQKKQLAELKSRQARIQLIRSNIRQCHRELLVWAKKLPLYYETPTQIFVHAGVEEDIPKDEMDYCTLGTPEYVFTGKYPPTTGQFYKDIIAGHTAASSVAGDPAFEGIFYDGASHYYIDGAVERTGKLLCLAYDEKVRRYFELSEDGTKKAILGKRK